VRTALPAAGFFLCLGIALLMTAADDRAQQSAELHLKLRLINKFPAAEFAAPVQHLQSNHNEKE
jgi:hypothetical protein